MRVNDCVSQVFSVKGDDVAYCIAEEKGLMALVADGASITELSGDYERALNAGIFASHTVARQLVEFYWCFRDERCGGEIPPEDLLNYYLNSTVSPNTEHFNILQRFADKLRELLSRGVKVVSSSTIAAGIATARGVIATSVGDSTITMTLCPPISEEILKSKSNVLDLISRVKYTSITAPRIPEFAKSNLYLSSPRLHRKELLFNAKVSVGLVPSIYIGPSALAAYSSIYNGIVMLAWSDGAKLETPSVSFNPGSAANYDTLDFMTGYIHNEATELLNRMLNLVERRLDVLADMKAYHILLLMGCLALNNLVGKESIEDVVKAILSDGSRTGLVEIADDRSISMVYGWPLIETGGGNSEE